MFRSPTLRTPFKAQPLFANVQRLAVCAIPFRSSSATPCAPEDTQELPQPLSHPTIADNSLYTPGVGGPPSSPQSPFAAALCKSPHQFHSMRFSRPLFSYSYKLFCTGQNAIFHVFLMFRTLCTKHPWWHHLASCKIVSFLWNPAVHEHRFIRRSSGAKPLGSTSALCRFQHLSSNLQPPFCGIIPPHTATAASDLENGRIAFRLRGGFSD